MEINDTLEEIRAADMIPQDHYKFLIVGAQTPDPPDTSWAFLKCKIIATKDPQLGHMIDKELLFWVIGQKTGRKYLGDFLQHKHHYDPEGGWEKGIPANGEGKKVLESLVGVTFDANVKSYEKKDGTFGCDIEPITIPDQPMLSTPEDVVPY